MLGFTLRRITVQQIKDYTDEQLLNITEEIYSDLQNAAETQPNSEWHEDCFGAMCVAAQEMNARGLKRKENV